MEPEQDRENLYLRYQEMCRYLEATTTSRNLNEGEAVLNGGLLIACGCTKRSSEAVEVLGLCLQTSALTKDPHTITAKLRIQNEVVTVDRSQCSCKAGLSEKCKHTAALLWKICRHGVTSLEDFSVTDIKCIWAEKKSPALENYSARPLEEFCCVPYKPRPVLDHAFQQKARALLEAAAPESALSKHRLCRMNVENATIPCDRPKAADEDLICKIFDVSRVSPEINNLTQPDVSLLQQCCQAVYSPLLVNRSAAMKMCCETAESKAKWKAARQFRITGSRCYSIFTYGSKKNTDWSAKASKYFWPSEICTKAMRHGIEYEAEARQVYAKLLDCVVKEVGLIVSPLQPWLGYSPDGVVVDEKNTPQKLLEIKCPMNGENVTASNLIDSLPYIVFKDGDVSMGITLKKKHIYYGQVQLGMAMLNVSKCDFVLFSSFNKSIQVVPVDYDSNFVEQMLGKLQRDYFLNMLHEICKRNAL